MRRFYITLGAPTTADGKVISANNPDTIDGIPMALEGDRCWCPACDAEGIIVLDGPRLSETFEGREFALSDLVEAVLDAGGGRDLSRHDGKREGQAQPEQGCAEGHTQGHRQNSCEPRQIEV